MGREEFAPWTTMINVTRMLKLHPSSQHYSNTFFFLQNLEIASNNPPSCDAYGQPLQAQPPVPPQPQPTASSAVSTATAVPANASPNSRPGSAYQQPQIQPRRDSDGQQDEQAKVEDRTSRKVEVYKYYERDAGTAVEEHFKRALDWANSNNREGGKKQRFLTVLPLGRRI